MPDGSVALASLRLAQSGCLCQGMSAQLSQRPHTPIQTYRTCVPAAAAPVDRHTQRKKHCVIADVCKHHDVHMHFDALQQVASHLLVD